MADPVVVKRIAQRLQALSESTPKGEGFWPALATMAAEEALRTLTVQQLALPVEPFMAAIRAHEGLRVIAKTPTLGGAQQAAIAFLEERGSGEALVMEVRRLLGVV